MRRTTILLAAILLLAGAAAGCSSDSDDKPTVSKATNTPSANTSSPTPTPSPSPETYKLGDTSEIKSPEADFAAAALAFTDNGIDGSPGLVPAGQKLVAVEAKVCNKGTEGFGVSPFVWSLAYADGARVEATHISGGDLPQPLYPLDAKVRVGDCVRGNILFQVPEEGRPERVLYSPEVVDEPVEWQIGK